jgi:hypothetical protein
MYYLFDFNNGQQPNNKNVKHPLIFELTLIVGLIGKKENIFILQHK